MPLYIGDYLADTMHLDASEHGAYLLLLMHYWRNGPLPDDDKALSAIARTTRKAWDGGIGAVVRKFFLLDGAMLRQKRVDAELSKAEANSVKKRSAATARWAEKNKKTTSYDDAPGGEGDACGDAHASDVDMHRICPYAGVPPSPSPSKKDSEASPLPQAAVAVASEPLPPAAIPDARSELWSEGLAIVRGLTGKPAEQARAIVGKIAQACRDDCALALSVLREARDLRPVGDPVAWLMAAAKARDDPNGRLLAAVGIGPNAQPVVNIFDALLPQGRLLQ